MRPRHEASENHPPGALDGEQQMASMRPRHEASENLPAHDVAQLLAMLQ